MTQLDRSIEELEGPVWGDADYPTSLVERCHKASKVPIGGLNPAEIRLLCGQGIGLGHLVPLALDLLATNPLYEAELYEGDLLAALVAGHTDYWRKHAAERSTLAPLVDRATERLGNPDPSMPDYGLLMELQRWLGTFSA